MGKEKIKKIVKRNPFLYAVLRVINNRRDARFISFVNGYNDNWEIIFAHPQTTGKYNRPVCRIVAGTRDDGFFACVRWALDGLYFCQKFGFTPVVSFPENSIYRDNEKFETEVNPFNYFFEDTVDNLPPNYPTVEYSVRNMKFAESLNGGITYKVSKEYIDAMAEIMAEKLVFRKDVIQYAYRINKPLLIDNRTLGVHIRGTDYRKNYKNHPVFLETEEYYESIDKAMENGRFNKIYLATDDEKILNEFIAHYGEKVTFSDQSERSKGEQGVHTSHADKKTPYYLGLDVISDMIALSSCGGLISGMSQVPLIARIYKKSQNSKYSVDIVLDKGINQKGMRFERK